MTKATPPTPESDLNELVRRYWQTTPNGTAPGVAGTRSRDARVWFEGIEQRRYDLEPFIHSAAQFTRHHGQRILEVGVGAGTDHLQWARAGAVCSGVDITTAAIELTRERLAIEGFTSDLRETDAERLPFENGQFDIVYSWGVIHHAERPAVVLAEIHRVLRPGGRLIAMMYHRYSAVAIRLWIRHGLLAGRPRRSLTDVVWHHMESIGTKAYTLTELRNLLADFHDVKLSRLATPYDRERIPKPIGRLIPDAFGWFVVIDARKVA
jgi:SAM-dependent methyltransferase